MWDFEGKKVLVTGASRGIGRAVAITFGARGATVAVNVRSNETSASETLDDLDGAGHVVVRADSQQEES